MRRNRKKIPTIYSVGAMLLTVGISVFSYFQLSGPSNLDSALATVSFKGDSPQIRRSGGVSWDRALPNQSVYSGESIATTAESMATVASTDGSKIEMEVNSQIQIRGSSSDAGNTLQIDLLRGSVKINSGANRAIEISSQNGLHRSIMHKDDIQCFRTPSTPQEWGTCGGKSPEVTSGQAVDSSDEFDRGKPTPDQANSDRKAPNAAVTKNSEQLPATKKSDAAPRNSITDGYEAQISPAVSGELRAWTPERMQGNPLIFIVRVQPPGKKAALKGWTPVIDILDKNGKTRNLLIVGAPQWSAQEIKIPTSVIRRAATVERDGKLTFQLRTGAITKGIANGGSEPSFSKQTIRVSLGSLQDLGPGPIEVRLASGRRGPISSQWIIQAAESEIRKAPVIISLNSGREINRLLPYLTTGAFEIRSKASIDPADMYVVKRMEVIAGLNGAIDKNLAKDLRGLFDADFIFRGKKADFFDSRNKNFDDLRRWIEGQVVGEHVYLMKSDQLLPVSKSLMKQQDQALQFAGKNASYIFAGQVNLIDVRSGL